MSVVFDSVRPQRQQLTRLPSPWNSPGQNTGVGCHFLLQCMKVKTESEVAQSCPTLSDPMDCSLPVQTQIQMEHESLSSSKNDSQQDWILIYIPDEGEVYGVKSSVCLLTFFHLMESEHSGGRVKRTEWGNWGLQMKRVTLLTFPWVRSVLN